jgi:hypothetical protein
VFCGFPKILKQTYNNKKSVTLKEYVYNLGLLVGITVHFAIKFKKVPGFYKNRPNGR